MGSCQFRPQCPPLTVSPLYSFPAPNPFCCTFYAAYFPLTFSHLSFSLSLALCFLAVPVVGNFTDEELLNVPPPNGGSGGSITPNTSEYPLQRDEVGRAVSSSGGERSQLNTQGK